MEVILHIGIAQFLFASLLIFNKKPKQLSDKVLGVWLISMGVFLVLSLLKWEFQDSFWSSIQLFPVAFTIGPFLLIYVRTLVQENPKLKPIYILHAVPFLFFETILILTDTKADFQLMQGNVMSWERVFFGACLFASIVSYCIWSVRLLNRHRHNILNHFSYSSVHIRLDWLVVLAVSFSATFALTGFAFFINVFLGQQVLNPGSFLFLGLTVFAYGCSYFGYRQVPIFEKPSSSDARFVDEISEELEQEEEKKEKEQQQKEEEDNAKYANSSLTQEEEEVYAKRLIHYMEEEQAYLRRDLNIQTVAEELSIPRHHLTQTINEYLNKNFYTLVNEYRVEEVKKRLVDDQYSYLTMLAIAHDAGFNSKSTFNMIFKKMTGQTPSQYKKAYFKQQEEAKKRAAKDQETQTNHQTA